MKTDYSTATGQRILCAQADSRATLFMMAAFLRKHNVPTWDDKFLHTVSGATLESVKADMLSDYNETVSKQLSHKQ